MKCLILILFFISLTFLVNAQSLCPDIFTCGDTLVDSRDGYKYPTVQIGTQCWFQVSLHSTKYINGDTIPDVTDPTAWSNLTTGAWCNNTQSGNPVTNGITYGHLYNWYAVNDNRSICPMGWYVPSQNELNVLINYIGGIASAGPAMKSTSSLWLAGAGTNTSGFSALPSGWRNSSGTCSYIGACSIFWCSTGNNSQAWIYNMDWVNNPSMNIGYMSVNWGLAVRCVKEY